MKLMNLYATFRCVEFSENEFVQVSVKFVTSNLFGLKKGGLSICNNYRGIAFLSLAGKSFNRILMEQIKIAVKDKLEDRQAGFCKN